MTHCNRGDVILVAFPNSDLATYKSRPALVIQADDIPTGIPQRIIAMITTNMERTGSYRIRINKTSPEGRQMGILKDSVVMTDNLATIDLKLVKGVIGHCPLMKPVGAAIRTILGI